MNIPPRLNKWAEDEHADDESARKHVLAPYEEMGNEFYAAGVYDGRMEARAEMLAEFNRLVDLSSRVPVGEDHWSAKLTEDQVREIFRRSSAGETRNSLAREFGVDKKTVRDIATGKRWAHLNLAVCMNTQGESE